MFVVSEPPSSVGRFKRVAIDAGDLIWSYSAFRVDVPLSSHFHLASDFWCTASANETLGTFIVPM